MAADKTSRQRWTSIKQGISRMRKKRLKMVMETKLMNEHMQVVLSGSIYVEEAKEVREVLSSIIDQGQTSLLINLAQVEYIDSTGLGMLVSIQKRAVMRGGSVRLQGLNGLVKELFELTRLTTVFEIH